MSVKQLNATVNYAREPYGYEYVHPGIDWISPPDYCELEMTFRVSPDEDINALATGGMIDSLFPGKMIVKCAHCGQWAARRTVCPHCGAAVD